MKQRSYIPLREGREKAISHSPPRVLPIYHHLDVPADGLLGRGYPVLPSSESIRERTAH